MTLPKYELEKARSRYDHALIHRILRLIETNMPFFNERRERDSNPRYPKGILHFEGRVLKQQVPEGAVPRAEYCFCNICFKNIYIVL